MSEVNTKVFSDEGIANLPSLYLIGISARTNNAQEANPEMAKIGQTIGRFWQDELPKRIPSQKTPGQTFSVYTDYDSDEKGDYTYFYGMQVDSLDEVPEGLTALTIPESRYKKFTTQAGSLPNIVIQAWQSIWKMTPAALGGQRLFHADFEIYDHRAQDPQNSIVDLFIGIKPA